MTSYSPLFLCVIIRQIFFNRAFLEYKEPSEKSLMCCIEKFGLSIFLGLLLILIAIGTVLFFKSMKEESKNGRNVLVKDVVDKNSESIGYIATYIVPFLFQNFDQFGDVAPMIILLLIIYRIYVTSSLILVNPVLNCKYSLFEIEYEYSGIRKKGLAISPYREIYEGNNIKIYNIGYKLFYVNKINLL